MSEEQTLFLCEMFEVYASIVKQTFILTLCVYTILSLTAMVVYMCAVFASVHVDIGSIVDSQSRVQQS